MNLVGLAGRAGAGKDTAATSFKQRNLGAVIISLSELVRVELASLGISASRGTQRFIANYRRITAGPGYWIDKAVALCPPDARLLVLPGLYAPEEAAHLHRLGGIVVWVEANETIRLKRIDQRQDGSRDHQASVDPKGFFQELKAEEGPQEKTNALVALSQVKELADYQLQNEGTVEELTAAMNALVGDMNKRFSKRKGNLTLLKPQASVRYEAAQPWADEPDRLLKLEKSHFFEEYLASDRAAIAGTEIAPEMSLRDVVRVLYRPNLRSITGNQTARRVGTIFEIPDPVTALSKLRSLKPSNQEEEYFTGLNDQEFYDVHLRAQVAWMEAKTYRQSNLTERLEQIQTIDRIQFTGKKDRGLDRMRKDGLLVNVDLQQRLKIKQLANNPILAVRPILEFIKNERIFEVSGFIGSKASVVVHDAIDHLWTFDLLDRIGLFAKYEGMFESIGNPEKVDIYKREGEAVASISYGVRAFEGVAPGFRPIMGSKDIVRLVREMRGRLSERHTDALRIVNNLESDGTEWRSLGYTFSNYITELDEQRRTYGTIKYRDPQTKRITSELDPFSPDYLCFFIETHHALLDSANKHRNALFYIHFLMEEYLRGLAEEEGNNEPISITLALLDGERLKYSNTVPKPAAEWMFRNYGFTANRNLV